MSPHFDPINTQWINRKIKNNATTMARIIPTKYGHFSEVDSLTSMITVIEHSPPNGSMARMLALMGSINSLVAYPWNVALSIEYFSQLTGKVVVDSNVKMSWSGSMKWSYNTV